jgi:hypothetical protein
MVSGDFRDHNSSIIPASNFVRGRMLHCGRKRIFARRKYSRLRCSYAALSAVVAASIIAILSLAGCGPTRCLTTAAFGNLGPEINSPYDDYAPALSDTATLVFTSNRIEPGEAGLQQFYHATRPTRLFFSMRLGAAWDTAQGYQILLDGNAAQGATISFAPPGSPFNTVAYVGACDRSDTIGGCDIYAVVDRQSMGLVNLGKEINSPDWDGQPFVTADGAHLYFVSDRPGGLGGTDIWISDRLPSGAWGEPHNAGPAINSSGDEFSPCFDSRSGRLYFASANGATGIDIFALDPGATARRALLPPYNSDANDFTPFILGNTLYLASNRTGGCGGYDLYAFELRDEGMPGR